MNTTKSKSTLPQMPLPKIIVVKQELANKEWNKHLLIPLVPSEKIIVHSDQSGIPDGYVRVKQGKNSISIFSRNHFITLGGKEVSKCS